MGTRCFKMIMDMVRGDVSNHGYDSASSGRYGQGRTKFTTTSGAHDVISITSPQENDLCTEELRDGA